MCVKFRLRVIHLICRAFAKDCLLVSLFDSVLLLSRLSRLHPGTQYPPLHHDDDDVDDGGGGGGGGGDYYYYYL